MEMNQLPQWLQDLWEINPTIARKAERELLSKRLWEAEFKALNPVPSAIIVQAPTEEEALDKAKSIAKWVEIQGVTEILPDETGTVVNMNGDY